MTLREYIANLQELAKERPEALDFEVIYIADWFDLVRSKPYIGFYDGSDFSTEKYTKEKPNAVCIN